MSELICKQMAAPGSRLYSTYDALAWSLDLARALPQPLPPPFDDARPRVHATRFDGLSLSQLGDGSTTLGEIPVVDGERRR